MIDPAPSTPPAAGAGDRGRRLVGFVQLLGSGVLAAAGLAAIAANRWHLLDGPTAVFLLLFVGWQTFCLTVAKCGLEHVVFATVSVDPALRYDVAAAVRRRVAPLGAAVALVALVAFPPWAAAALGASVVLDGYAL